MSQHVLLIGMRGRTSNLTIRISPQTKAELQRLADEDHRTLSQLVALILDQYLTGRAKGKGQ
jgi:predicted transcriptional regulator